MTGIFLTFLGISATVGAAVLLIQCISPFIDRRYAAKWKYLIWIFLSVRLLIPVSGLYQKKPSENAAPTPQTDTEQSAPAADYGETVYMMQPQRFVVEIPVQAVEKIAAQPQKSRPSVSVLDVAVIVWLAGAAVFAGVHLVSYALFRRKIMRHGEKLDEGATYELMQSLRAELGIKSKISLVCYPEASSPMIIGFARPALILPDDKIDSGELYFIIRHELIHQKRHDVYVKLLGVFANAVHWFNPAVWLMRRQTAIDMELSCDEGVVRGADLVTKKAYTETLMSALTRQTSAGATLSTQFYGGKSTMKKRFKNILGSQKKRNGIVLLTVTALLTVALGTLVGCTQRVSLPSDDELKQMIEKYLEYESYALYSNPDIASKRPLSDDPADAGSYTFPVVQKGLKTWQEWLDYLGGIFTEKGVETALKQTEDRYLDYDGKLYYRDGGIGWTILPEFTVDRVEQTSDKAFTAEFRREYSPDFYEGDLREFNITTLKCEYTRVGWRIAEYSDRYYKSNERKPESKATYSISTTLSTDLPLSVSIPERWNYYVVHDGGVIEPQHTGVQIYDGELPEQKELYGGKLFIAAAANGRAETYIDSEKERGKTFTEDSYITDTGYGLTVYYADTLPKFAVFDEYPDMCIFFNLDEDDVLDTIFGIIDTISFEREPYFRLTEERVNELIEKYRKFESYLHGALSDKNNDSDKKVTVDGRNYLPVTEEGLTTWQEWSDFMLSFMTDVLAERCEGQYSDYDKRYINHDGKLYVEEDAVPATPLSVPFKISFRPNQREAVVEFWRESKRNIGKYHLTVLKLRLVGSEWLIDGFEDHDTYSDLDGYEPSFGMPTSAPLNEEKVKKLVRDYLLFERFTVYDSLYYDTSRKSVIIGDNAYYPVTEDGLTTYQEWSDFVHGIFTDEVAKEYLRQEFEDEKRLANVDGKLYSLEVGGMGWYLDSPCQVAYNDYGSTAVVEFWQEYLEEGSEGEYRVTVFNLRSTESGWRVESLRVHNSYNGYDGYAPMLEKPDGNESDGEMKISGGQIYPLGDNPAEEEDTDSNEAAPSDRRPMVYVRDTLYFETKYVKVLPESAHLIGNIEKVIDQRELPEDNFTSNTVWAPLGSAVYADENDLSAIYVERADLASGGYMKYVTEAELMPKNVPDEEELNRLYTDYLKYDHYTTYGMAVDWQNPELAVTKDGYDYAPSVEEGMTTWQEWNDFIHSIFEKNLAETTLSLYSEDKKRYIDVDGKLYLRDNSVGIHYGEPCQAGSRTVGGLTKLEYWQEALFEGEEGTYLITVLNIENTDDGWRITSTESHMFMGDDGYEPILEKPAEADRTEAFGIGSYWDWRQDYKTRPDGKEVTIFADNNFDCNYLDYKQIGHAFGPYYRSVKAPEGWKGFRFSGDYEVFENMLTGTPIYDGEIPVRIDYHDVSTFFAAMPMEKSTFFLAESPWIHAQDFIDDGDGLIDKFDHETYTDKKGRTMQVYFIDGLPRFACYDDFYSLCIWFNLKSKEQIPIVVNMINSVEVSLISEPKWEFDAAEDFGYMFLPVGE